MSLAMIEWRRLEFKVNASTIGKWSNASKKEAPHRGYEALAGHGEGRRRSVASDGGGLARHPVGGDRAAGDRRDARRQGAARAARAGGRIRAAAEQLPPLP